MHEMAGLKSTVICSQVPPKHFPKDKGRNGNELSHVRNLRKYLCLLTKSKYQVKSPFTVLFKVRLKSHLRYELLNTASFKTFAKLLT